MSKFKITNKQDRATAMKNRGNKSPSFINKKVNLEEWKPSDGENAIRVVPPLHDETKGFYLGIDVRVFFMNNSVFISPNTFDSSIKDCIYPEFAKAKAKNADESILKQLRGTQRTLMFIVNPEDDPKTVKYWLAPKTALDGILGASKNRRTGELYPVECPTEGKLIFFEKTGSGLLTKYSGFSLDSEPMPLDDAIADQLVHFEDLLVVPTVDEVKDHIESIFDDADDADDADEYEADAQTMAEELGDLPDEPVDEPVKEESKTLSLKERMAERKKRMRKAHEDPSGVTV